MKFCSPVHRKRYRGTPDEYLLVFLMVIMIYLPSLKRQIFRSGSFPLADSLMKMTLSPTVHQDGMIQEFLRGIAALRGRFLLGKKEV